MTLRPEDPITLNGGRGMELINKQKLSEHIDSVIELYGGDLVLQTIKSKIQSGTFDVHSAQDTAFERALANAECGDCLSAQEEISKLKMGVGMDEEERHALHLEIERLEARAIQAVQERDARYEFDKQRTIRLEEERNALQTALDLIEMHNGSIDSFSEIEKFISDARSIIAKLEGSETK